MRTRGVIPRIACGWVMCVVLTTGGPVLAATGWKQHFDEGLAHYRNLEWDEAELSLNMAMQAVGPDAGERWAQVRLWQGILHYQRRQFDEAKTAFREVLSVRPTEKLPDEAPPGARNEFERQRAFVAADRPNPNTTPVKKPPTDRRKSSEPDKVADAEPLETRVEPEPKIIDVPKREVLTTEPSSTDRTDLTETPRVSENRGTHWSTWTFAATTVAAGGAGTFFGMRSRSSLEAAAGMPSPDAYRAWSSAKTDASRANLLFGAAAAAAVGTLVTALVLHSDGESP